MFLFAVISPGFPEPLATQGTQNSLGAMIFFKLSREFCFLVDKSKVHDEHVESGNLDLTALDTLISCGEFHICGPWTGGPAKRLLLPKGTRFRGKLILWIGGYVGDCVYAMETIIQSFHKPITYALKDLLAIHANENDVGLCTNL